MKQILRSWPHTSATNKVFHFSFESVFYHKLTRSELRTVVLGSLSVKREMRPEERDICPKSRRERAILLRVYSS
jgi:hypothetical protein